MVIILSAIASIDTEIFESAQIDGANGIQTAWYITLPLIKNTMLVCITLCVAGNMKAFDNIYVMTKVVLVPHPWLWQCTDIRYPSARATWVMAAVFL